MRREESSQKKKKNVSDYGYKKLGKRRWCEKAIHTGRPGTTRAQQRLPWAAVLLFKSDVSQVSVIDTDDTVVLLEEALLLGLPSPLQTLDQQAKSPEMFRSSCQEDAVSVDSTWLLKHCGLHSRVKNTLGLFCTLYKSWLRVFVLVRGYKIFDHIFDTV